MCLRNKNQSQAYPVMQYEREMIISKNLVLQKMWIGENPKNQILLIETSKAEVYLFSNKYCLVSEAKTSLTRN